jgi:hypothetical protein
MGNLAAAEDEFVEATQFAAGRKREGANFRTPK